VRFAWQVGSRDGARNAPLYNENSFLLCAKSDGAPHPPDARALRAARQGDCLMSCRDDARRTQQA